MCLFHIDTCSIKVNDASPILMISNLSSIVSVDLDTNTIDQYGVHCYIVSGIDYDLVNRMIYWSEVILGLIRRVSLDNHSNGSVIETVVTGLYRPEQIAVDWVNRKLYWTDYGKGVIKRSDLNGSNIEVLVNVEIIPRAMVVDPFHKTIYWINYKPPRSIEKLSTNGLYKQSLVNVANPSGLTIDYDNNLLYWTDDHVNQLMSCDLGGHNMKVLPVSILVTQPYAVTVFQSNLYWTDHSNSYINIVNQFTGANQGSIFASLNQPTGICVIHYSRQPGICKLFIIKSR